jgi:predicted aldo/keto reductase-like oxidoreductase
MTAVEKGVNYFDTAWMYPGSEDALGAVLEKNGVREKVFIATKLPAALVKKTGDFDRFFNEELKRLRTNYIDYYLMHNLTSSESWKSLAALGIEAWIAEKKKTGAIRQIGFSFHGSSGEFFNLLDIYPWEFCQIQYNYSDENFQAGIKGLKKAAETMPVIIMEPLLGGKLANGLPGAALDLFRAAGTASGKPLSPAAWALRWVWNHPEAAVVLSGMTDSAQIIENVENADAAPANSLSAAELDVYRQAREIFNASYRVHCTGCGYCMPCPHNVNIPGCFAAYNTSFSMGWAAGMQQYMTSAAFTSAQSFGAGNCAACGRCEGHCPQKIPIIESLKQVRKRLEPLYIRAAIAVLRKFLGQRQQGRP